MKVFNWHSASNNSVGDSGCNRYSLKMLQLGKQKLAQLSSDFFIFFSNVFFSRNAHQLTGTYHMESPVMVTNTHLHVISFCCYLGAVSEVHVEQSELWAALSCVGVVAVSCSLAQLWKRQKSESRLILFVMK